METSVYVGGVIGLVVLIFNVWLLDRWLGHQRAVEGHLAELVANSERCAKALEKQAAG